MARTARQRLIGAIALFVRRTASVAGKSGNDPKLLNLWPSSPSHRTMVMVITTKDALERFSVRGFPTVALVDKKDRARLTLDTDFGNDEPL